jgi:hypothetical protein
MPPLPVERDLMGFWVFCHPDGYFSTAVMVGSVRHYARDYKQYAGVAVDVTPIEPGELDFAAAMGW